MQAIFLDRDGVINVDTDYAHKPEQIIFVPGIFDFCRAAREAGYGLIVITNQAGIGRGYYTEEQFHALMAWMMARFEAEGCPLTSYYFCPNHPEHGIGKYKVDCEFRKPKPGMILQAAAEWDVDLAKSIMIGDKDSDIQAAKAAGVGQQFLFTSDFQDIPL